MSQAIYSIAGIRALEQLSMQKYGIHDATLMQRAGEFAYHTLRATWPTAKNIGIFCGGGNNGGDGFVVALLCHQAGLKVQVYTLKPVAELSGVARQMAFACVQANVSIQAFGGEIAVKTEVIVDALLGIGCQGVVNDPYLTTIKHINRLHKPVLAIDMPSGIDANTGHVPSVAICATVTVTFIALKLGLVTGEALNYVGAVKVADLNLPAEVFEDVPADAMQLSLTIPPFLLAPRKRHTHKGEHGHVVVVGGMPGMSGAASLCAQAALRIGAGLVSVATHPMQTTQISAGRPEIMCHGICHLAQLKQLLARATVIAVGPGLGRNLLGNQWLQCVLTCDVPMVIDADALWHLAKLAPDARSSLAHAILTPHPGEAAFLLQSDVSSIQSDRLYAMQKIAAQYSPAGIVLKGAGSLIATTKQISICSLGNPAMASGGLGDVLTGMIAGLLAQGITAERATPLATWLHARAGDLAQGPCDRGLLASDLIEHIRFALAEAISPGCHPVT